MTKKLNKILLNKYSKLVTMDVSNYASEDELLNAAAETLNRYADSIELVGKNIPSGQLLNISRKLRDLTGYFNAFFIVYDRIDIAKLSGANAVSLDKDTISINAAKELLYENILLGYRATTEEEGLFAKENGVDFLITTRQYFDDIKEFCVTKK